MMQLQYNGNSGSYLPVSLLSRNTIGLIEFCRHVFAAGLKEYSAIYALPGLFFPNTRYSILFIYALYRRQSILRQRIESCAIFDVGSLSAIWYTCPVSKLSKSNQLMVMGPAFFFFTRMARSSD